MRSRTWLTIACVSTFALAECLALPLGDAAISPAQSAVAPRADWLNSGKLPPLSVAPRQSDTIAELGDGLAPPTRWLNDKKVTFAERASVDPALAIAPDGRMWIAVEDHGNHEGWVSVHQSLDGGDTWSWRISFRTLDASRNPTMTYVERAAGDQWLFLIYTAESGATRNIQSIRFDPRTLAWNAVPVATGITGTPEIYPRVCSDNAIYDIFYIYVVYSVNAVDFFPTMFSRSTDGGATFDTPIDVTGGSESSSFLARPAVGYGTAGLFVAFEKPGWTETVWTTQVWVRRSTNFGVTWAAPIQLTSNEPGSWHPDIAAGVGTPSVVVAYTRHFTSDDDIFYAYSTDSGGTYTLDHALPWTFADEACVSLAATPHSGGRIHAAWWRAGAVAFAWTNAAAPAVWSAVRVVNEGGGASPAHPRPAIAVDETRPPADEACVAWTDVRDATSEVFFDAGFRHVGDMNCDGIVSVGDIGPFVLALTDPAGYAAAFPACDINNGDTDGNTVVSVGDIAGLVAILTAG